MKVELEATTATPTSSKVELPKLTLKKFEGDVSTFSYETAIHSNTVLSQVESLVASSPRICCL